MLSRLRAPAQKASSFRYFSTVKSVKAREVIDSRGNPTVEVDLTTEDGVFRSIVPSGASTGAYEAHEKRDGQARYKGKGVLSACKAVNNKINQAIQGKDVSNQKEIDEFLINLDGTDNKRNLGANAILGVSMSVAKAGAAAQKIPLYRHFANLAGNEKEWTTLPVPCFNVINGGVHAGNPLAFQEFFVIPTGAESFKEAMQMGCETFHTLKQIIRDKFGSEATLIGDEGGFAPPVDASLGLELLMRAIEDLGYTGKIKLGLDVAASEFKKKGKDIYDLDFKARKINKDELLLMRGHELGQYYAELCKKFPIVTIEDPYDQDDWEHWTKLGDVLEEHVQIVADDLTVTNKKRIQTAVDKKAANALLLKINQVGTITESIDAVKLSKSNGWGVMTSHRSGETEDTTIADLAVGLCTGQIKAGAPSRGERTAKYNQLLRIEEELGDKAEYAGTSFRTPKWMN